MGAHQAPPSLGFSRQEHWSGFPFPSPMHESEKWQWSRSLVSNSLRPHGLQPTKLLHPWDFLGFVKNISCVKKGYIKSQLNVMSSLAIRKVNIKTTRKYHFVCTSVSVIKKTDNKCWWEGGEIGTFVHCLWESKMIWRTILQFLKVLNTELPHASNSLLGVHPRELKT